MPIQATDCNTAQCAPMLNTSAQTTSQWLSLRSTERVYRELWGSQRDNVEEVGRRPTPKANS